MKKVIKGLFFNNIEANPLLSAPEKMEFTLQKDSPCIDAGTFITKTRSSGKGRMIPVIDALGFCDGFSIPGISGDTIRIEGDRTEYVITAIDYNNNVLTIDKDAIWENSRGVSLKWAGVKPDIGTFEYCTPVKTSYVRSVKRSIFQAPHGYPPQIQVFNLHGTRIPEMLPYLRHSLSQKSGTINGIYLIKTGIIIKKELL